MFRRWLKIFSENQKFRFSQGSNQNISSAVPPRMRGVSRSSRTLGRDAVDASCAFDERAVRGGRSRVVLTPRRWRQVREVMILRATVARKPGSPGRARYKPLKPFACGNAG